MREPRPDKSDVVTATLLTLAGCAWLSLVLSGAAADIANALHQYRAERFPTTTGRVTGSYVQEDWRENKDKTKPPYAFYRPMIDYQYQVGGKVYRGNRYRCQRSNSDSDPAPAHRLVAEFPVGREVPVYYDPRQPDDALLSPGIIGRDLFLFPALIFVAAGLIALRFMCGWWRDNFIRPDTGGVRVRFKGNRVRARLPRFSPLLCGLVTAALLSAATVVVLNGGAAHSMTVRNVGYAWAVVSAGPAVMFIGFWLRLAFGLEDLVIDQEAGTITLPRNFGRWHPITIGLNRIVSADLLESGEGRQYQCHPTLFFSNPELKSARLARWGDRRKGRAFIAWLRNQLWP
jgi:Protein of unknown function (DUF3592)